MERRCGDNRLLGRILSADGPGVVVWGPAACGKTTAALGVYRHYQDEAGCPACWLLVPNARAAGRLRRGLVDASDAGVAVSPAVMTFGALTGRILAAAKEPARGMSAFHRHLLLSRIVADLHTRGRLGALAPVADTPGLIVALDRAIAELKRAAIEPDDLARAVGEAPDKRGDLVAIYRRYQQELLAVGAYDVEGQAWLAREHLRRIEPGSPLPGLEAVRAVVADGFTDFTPTQLEILFLLAERGRRVVITLPLARDGRRRMWHWTSRTLQRLRERFGSGLVEIDAGECAAASEDQHAALRVLWDHAFRHDATCPMPEGFSVLAASGIDAEVGAVARRVKALLHDGAAPGSLAVLARNLDAYREPILRIFGEHDVPVAPAPRPLTDEPIVRFLLDVASLWPELAWRDCLAVLRNSYFRPRALGEAYGAATVQAAEALIRDGNVLAGREEYLRAADRMAARAERQEAEDDDEPGQPSIRRPDGQTLRQAREMLEGLFDLAERAADPARLREDVEALELPEAAERHGDGDLIARDLRALAALADCLSALPGPGVKMAHVREALSAADCPAAGGESLVDVLDVLDARAARYEHVFLLGVSERQFPPRYVEGSLIGEGDRARWPAHGVVLDRRRDLTAREMLLFYLAVSRARQTLTVSYLDADASGGAGSPSSFLLSLLEPAGGLAEAPHQTIPPGMLVPPAGELASQRDAFNAGVAGLFGQGAPDALAWAVHHAPTRTLRAAMGIWAHHRRWQPGACNEFDGRITDPALREELARRFPGATIFSAGRLDTYGQCPWQYFATYLLKLAPLSEPQRRLEPQTRGTFCHNVLFRVMRVLGERLGRPVRLAEIDEALLIEALDEAVAAEAADVEARRPPYAVLWRIQLQQMRQALWEYLAAARSRGELKAESLHFELAFGPGADPSAPRDEASRSEPVHLTTPAGELLLRGRIDRVDRIRFDEVEGLLVVDYKTGRLPSEADMRSGRSLQMPLYAAAAEAILHRPCVGGAFHRIGATTVSFERFFAAVTTARGLVPYKLDEAYETKRHDAMETVARFVRQMAAGQFDALPGDRCPTYCPFRQICHYSPARARIKADDAAGEGP